MHDSMCSAYVTEPNSQSLKTVSLVLSSSHMNGRNRTIRPCNMPPEVIPMRGDDSFFESESIRSLSGARKGECSV